jgi:uncharacterized glyoxalase superfamily metalloenzyme YdcJ
MKIYFTASARGKKKFGNLYQEIFQTIEKLGHDNIDSTIIDNDSDDFYDGSHEVQIKVYEQAMKNIKDCDVVVLEVSVHSLSMGYVMQKALEKGKPVIAIYYQDHLPHFAAGIEDDKLQVIDYDEHNLENALKDAFDFAKDHQDARFNFFISPTQLNYLDSIARDTRTPRSVILRSLIEKDMAKNSEYQDEL